MALSETCILAIAALIVPQKQIHKRKRSKWKKNWLLK